MQKVWKQIGLFQHYWGKLDFFKQKNNIATDGDAIVEIMKRYERFQTIVRELEKRSNEMEKWKERAETNVVERKQ